MHRKRWTVAPLTAVMVLGLAFGAGPAAASEYPPYHAYGQACNYDYVHFNACLNIFAGTEEDFSVIVGIDLRMSKIEAQAALRRGSHFHTTLYSTASYGIVLPVRYGWPKAGLTGIGAQFGFDNMILNEVRGDNVFQAEIVFTEVHADGSTTTRTYRTGIIQHWA